MRSADTAMYTAKAQGKHRIVMFEPSMYESNLHRFNLHSDLQRALDRRRLAIHFQPIVRSAHKICSVSRRSFVGTTPASASSLPTASWRSPSRPASSPRSTC